MGLLPDLYVRSFHVPKTEVVSPLLRRGFSPNTIPYTVGTFIRTKAIDVAIEKMTDEITAKVQIVVLGAGFDTRWPRLFSKNTKISLYIEVDYQEVVETKRLAFHKSKLAEDGRHCMVAFDLLEETQSLMIALFAAGLNKEHPIIILAECCFMYLPRMVAINILKAFRDSCYQAHMVIYEPLLLNDSFSNQMIRNFHARNINLESHQVKSRSELIKMLTSSGWTVKALLDMYELERSDFITSHDRERLRMLAALDEYEEWDLVSAHYYLAILYHSCQ